MPSQNETESRCNVPLRRGSCSPRQHVPQSQANRRDEHVRGVSIASGQFALPPAIGIAGVAARLDAESISDTARWPTFTSTSAQCPCRSLSSSCLTLYYWPPASTHNPRRLYRPPWCIVTSSPRYRHLTYTIPSVLTPQYAEHGRLTDLKVFPVVIASKSLMDLWCAAETLQSAQFGSMEYGMGTFREELLRLEDEYGCLAANPKYLTEEQRARMRIDSDSTEEDASDDSEDDAPESKADGDPGS